MKNLKLKAIFAFLAFPLGAAPVANDIPVPANVDRKLIVEYPAKPNEYFTFEGADRICDTYKSLKADPSPNDVIDPNQESYFYVLCKINWDEKEKKVYGLVQMPEWLELGKDTTIKESRWGYFYGEKPILEKRLVPTRDLVAIKNIRVLSISVWGVGNINTLPWKVLYSSADVGGGDAGLLFERYAEAKRHCNRIRYQRSLRPENALRYDRAKCKIFLDEKDQGYFFEIRTKNPLI